MMMVMVILTCPKLLDIYCVPGTVLNPLLVLLHIVLTGTLED